MEAMASGVVQGRTTEWRRLEVGRDPLMYVTSQIPIEDFTSR